MLFVKEKIIFHADSILNVQENTLHELVITCMTKNITLSTYHDEKSCVLLVNKLTLPLLYQLLK